MALLASNIRRTSDVHSNRTGFTSRFASSVSRRTRSLVRVLVGVAGLLGPAAAQAQYVDFTYTPGGGMYEVGQQITVTVEFCGREEAWFDGPGSVYFNGQWVNFDVNTGSDPFCSAYQVGTGTITLEAGVNTLEAMVAGNGSWETIEFYETSASPPPPSVTAPAADTALSGESRTLVDSVRNSGSSTVTYTLTATGCPGGCNVPATVTVASGQSAAVTIGYTAGTGGASGTSGTITLTASDGIQQGSASTNYYVLPNPVVAVVVEGEGSTERIIVAGQTSRVYFVVRNPSTAGPWTYTISLTGCTGVVSNCAPSNSSVVVPASSSSLVSVAYTSANTADQPGSIGLRAALVNKPAANALASLSLRTVPGVATTPTAGPTPVVEWVAGPGAIRQTEKAACLHFRLVPDVAATCGALEVVHPLPAVRTFNFQRRPTLVYYSDAAAPVVNVAVNILPPASQAVPDSVRTQLLLPLPGGGYTVQASRTDAGSAWADRTVKRVGLAISPPSSAPAQLVRYQVLVTFFRGGAAEPQSVVEREVAVVNRQASPFGAGWWLATLEQLYPLGDTQRRVLWVDGDAGTRVYTPTAVLGNGDSVFVAAAFAAADTLIKLVPRPPGDSLASTGYVRRLGHPRARVEFDAIGAERRVVTELGHLTSYVYADTITGPTGQPMRALQRIVVAPEGAGLAYDFHYTGGFLTSVTAPGSRLTVLTQATASGLGATARQVTRITDADTTHVDLTYAAANPAVMETRVDRRGNSTSFTYGAASRTLATVGTYANPLQLVQHTLRTGYAIGAGSTVPLAIDSTVTVYNGPRTDVTDVTRFWLDSLGQVTRIINALGDATVIERADTRWPALATRTVSPTGAAGSLDTLVTTAVYDARGRVLATTVQNPLGDGRNSTTTYGWDDRWNTMTRVTSAEGVTSHTGYDFSTGYRIWQQVGPDPARRVNFEYYTSGLASGLVKSTTLPGGTPDLYTYDPTLANLSQVRTPLGFITTTVADALGRDTLTIGPGGVRTRQQYNLSDQVKDQWTAAGSGTAAETVYVHTDYDPEGQPLEVSRRAFPDPNNIGPKSDRWWYDALGRDTLHSGMKSHLRKAYDPAGLVVSSNRGDSSRYDALGRMTWHWLPAVTPSFALTNTRLQDEPTNGAPADIELFSYDRGGNLTLADNRYAKIRRSYYPNGAIRRDSSARRTEREYDLDGRPIRLRHDALSGSTTATLPDVVEYGYDPVVGALSTVRDPQSNLFTYAYDNALRVQSLSLQSGVVNSYTYDADSRVQSYEGIQVTRDERGKVLHYPGTFMTYDMTYSPLGNLTKMTRGTSYQELYVRDALGNAVSSEVNTGMSDPMRGKWRYYYSQGLVHQTWKYRHTQPYVDTYVVDIAQAEHDQFGGQMMSRSNSYAMRSCPGDPYDQPFQDAHGQYMTYDANGRLRYVVNKTGETYPPQCTVAPDSTWTSGVAYRYDALGRRIWWENTGQELDGPGANLRCCSIVSTQIWDGAQLLEETRLSSVVASGRSGRVVYTHALGIDQPLTIARRDGGYDCTILPRVSWRGLLDDSGRQALGTTCSGISWPERDYMATRHHGVVADGQDIWDGSLVTSAQDAAGLLYMRNRYYDAKTGQFTQEDPIGLAGGLNLYGYANGDPVNFSDPFGLMVDPVTGTVIVVAGTQAVISAGTAAAGAVVAAGAGVVAAGAQAAGGVLSVVYRSLRAGENITNGLVARAPDAGNSVASHVAGRRLSQWISTTKSLEVAARLHARQDGGEGLVKIALSRVSSEIVDVSEGLGNSGMVSNWAKAAQEVLIKNYVPPEAITRIKPQ